MAKNLPGLKEYLSFFKKFVSLTLPMITGKPNSCTGNSNPVCWLNTSGVNTTLSNTTAM